MNEIYCLKMMIRTILGNKKKFTELSDRVLVSLSDFVFSLDLHDAFLSTEVAFITGQIQRGAPALFLSVELTHGNDATLVTHPASHPSEAQKYLLEGKNSR